MGTQKRRDLKRKTYDRQRQEGRLSKFLLQEKWNNDHSQRYILFLAYVSTLPIASYTLSNEDY
jgi:hypothetical protein